MENLALRKRAATSAWAVDAMTFLIILAMTAMEFDEQTVGFTKEDMATCATSCFAGYNVGSVAVNRKNHVADSVHFGDAVIEKVNDIFGSFLGAVGFGSGEIVEAVHHGVVQGSRDVKELAGDLFKAFGLCRCERR